MSSSVLFITHIIILSLYYNVTLAEQLTKTLTETADLRSYQKQIKLLGSKVENSYPKWIKLKVKQRATLCCCCTICNQC